ncbi:MAG: hypothetical protein Q7R80_02015 [bacterium]|nr:hypothetical protein [bacterium]
MDENTPRLDCVPFVRTVIRGRIFRIWKDVVRAMDFARRDAPSGVPLAESPASCLALALHLAEEDAPRDQPCRIEAIRSAILPFIETHGLGRDIDTALRDFFDDLATVEIFERGGLDALNAWIAERMAWLQQPGRTRDELEKEGWKLNGVLYRLLYVYPLATGIVIRLKPGCRERTPEMFARYGQHELHRRALEQFLDRYTEERGVPFDDTFVIPMPYAFTTGTHGSGERAAMAGSHVSVEFTTMDPRDLHEPSVPALAFTIAMPVLFPDLTHFRLDEIAEFRVTDEFDTYTPYEGYLDGQRRLMRRRAPLHHYLSFRQFSALLSTERLTKLRSLFPDLTQDEERPMRGNLLEPHFHDSVLWSYEYREGTQKFLRHGFLGEVDEREEATTLYEYVNIDVPNVEHDSSSVANAVLFIRARRGELGEYARAFRGRDEIIRRLGMLPVSPRRF